MKKIVLMMIISLTVFLLAGCDFFTTKPTTTTLSTLTSSVTTESTSLSTTTSEIDDEFAPFIDAINDFNEEELFGHTYEKQQTIDDFIIYSTVIELKIVTFSPVMAKLSFYESKLADFESENQFDITSYEMYFVGNETTMVVDGVESSSNEIYEPLSIDLNLMRLLDKSILSSWEAIDQELQVIISSSQAEVLFNESVGDVIVVIGLDAGKILDVRFQYSVDGYTFTIKHYFVYEAYPITIMNRNTN